MTNRTLIGGVGEIKKLETQAQDDDILARGSLV